MPSHSSAYSETVGPLLGDPAAGFSVTFARNRFASSSVRHVFCRWRALWSRYLTTYEPSISDILDLARVLEEEPQGRVSTAWSLLHPGRDELLWRLLLRIEFQRPISCAFVVRFDVHDHPGDQLRQALPLLLAASGFAIAFDLTPADAPSLLWVPAPAARECVFDVLVAGMT
jgi:hypothetical protein